jgi:hypothetical protein
MRDGRPGKGTCTPSQFFGAEDDPRFHDGSRHSQTICDLHIVKTKLILSGSGVCLTARRSDRDLCVENMFAASNVRHIFTLKSKLLTTC